MQPNLNTKFWLCLKVFFSDLWVLFFKNYPLVNKRFKYALNLFFFLVCFSAKNSLKSAHTWYFSYSVFCVAGRLGGIYLVLNLQNSAWGDAFVALTKHTWNAAEIQWKFCFKFRYCPRIWFEDQKKKIFIKIWSDFVSTLDWKKKKALHHNLVQYLAGLWDLLELTATFLSNHPDVYF